MEYLLYNKTPILVLSINLITSISYFILYSNQALKEKFFRLPLFIQKLYVALFVAPLFIAPFLHQSRFFEKSTFFISAGLVITSIGLILILFSFFKIGVIPSIKGKGGLSTTGTYKIVRHPIYAGTIITQVGLTMMNQSSITLFYLPLSIFLYYLMATLEEKDLCEIFGNEYDDYKKTIKKKIIPFIL